MAAFDFAVCDVFLPKTQKMSSQNVPESLAITPDALTCSTLNIEPISVIIHRLTAFFLSLPLTPEPPGPTNR